MYEKKKVQEQFQINDNQSSLHWKEKDTKRR